MELGKFVQCRRGLQEATNPVLAENIPFIKGTISLLYSTAKKSGGGDWQGAQGAE